MAKNGKNGSKAADRRHNVFGQSMTSVIRALGKRGFKFPEAKRALAKKRVKPADATIRIMLSAGKLGNRGDVATLTQDQVQQLKNLAAVGQH